MAFLDISSLPSSRKEAKAIGSRHYFTGVPCKKGHIEPRATGCGGCMACSREHVKAHIKKKEQDPIYLEERRSRMRRKYQENADFREMMKERKRTAYHGNPEYRRRYIQAETERGRRPEVKAALSAANKLRRETNPEWASIEKARKKKWALENKAYVNSRTARRRARLALAQPAWADPEALADVYRNCPPGMQVDHIIPLRGKNVSGLHVPENLQYLTPQENARKRHFYEVE